MLYKSPEKSLHQMLLHHQKEVIAFLTERANLEDIKEANASDGSLANKEDVIMSLEQ